jgi:hypothetical protein
MNGLNWTEIRNKLSEPFPAEDTKFLPKGKLSDKGNILATAYIDARMVEGRLDDVVGPGDWSFEWDPIHESDKRVAVRGTLIVLGQKHQDVGEANGEEELWKSAVSGALKRCAVQVGIGRYLYQLDRIYVKGIKKNYGGKERVYFADDMEPSKKLAGILDARASENPACSCGVKIEPKGNLTIQQVVRHSIATYGEPLCLKCRAERKQATEGNGDAAKDQPPQQPATPPASNLNALERMKAEIVELTTQLFGDDTAAETAERTKICGGDIPIGALSNTKAMLYRGHLQEMQKLREGQPLDLK